MQEVLKMYEVEALSKSTVNELKVRYDSSAETTWKPATQHVSRAQGNLLDNPFNAQVR